MRKNYFALLLSFFLLPFALNAQNTDNTPLATRLKNHVAVLASDSLEGRGLGTEGKILAPLQLHSTPFHSVKATPNHSLKQAYPEADDARPAAVGKLFSDSILSL